MSFRILTTMTSDYIEAIRLFVPSWFANSGASSIRIDRLPDGEWGDVLAARLQWMRHVVLTEPPQRTLLLDADCVVVRDLAAGFSPVHPISVTRWGNVNAGVMFFDRTQPFEWGLFFERILMRYSQHRKQGHRLAEQMAINETLVSFEPFVHKLDRDEWNYTRPPERWAEDLAAMRDTMRVIHVKGSGNWSPDKLAIIHENFPEVC